MNARLVTVALSWLRKADSGSLSEISQYDLFVAAFPLYEQVDRISRSRIEHDLQQFDTSGAIPEYVSRFLREAIFPLFVVHPATQSEGEESCTSEQRL